MMKILKRVGYRGYGIHQRERTGCLNRGEIEFAVRFNRRDAFVCRTFESAMLWVDTTLDGAQEPPTTKALLADLGKELARELRAQNKEKTMKSKKEVKKAQAKKPVSRKGHTLPSEPTAEFKPGQPVAVLVGEKPIPGFEFVERKGKFFYVKNAKKGTQHRVWLNKLQAA